jgi:hypothetical protein
MEEMQIKTMRCHSKVQTTDNQMLLRYRPARTLTADDNEKWCSYLGRVWWCLTKLNVLHPYNIATIPKRT